MRATDLFGPVRGDDEDLRTREAANDAAKRLDARGLGPVQVLEDEDERTRSRQRDERLRERVEQTGLLAFRIEPHQRRNVAAEGAQLRYQLGQRSEQRRCERNAGDQRQPAAQRARESLVWAALRAAREPDDDAAAFRFGMQS